MCAPSYGLSALTQGLWPLWLPSLQTIFDHYIQNRPVSYKTRNPGPSRRWTFGDLTRFAHDFRVSPGVAQMPLLLQLFQMVRLCD